MTATLVTKVATDHEDGDFDLGGLAFDPRDGTSYATNDD